MKTLSEQWHINYKKKPNYIPRETPKYQIHMITAKIASGMAAQCPY